MASPPLLRRMGTALLALAVHGAALAQAQVDARIFTAAEQTQAAYLDTLRQLVQVESGSKDVDGVRRLAHVVARQFKALGGDVQTLAATDLLRLSDTPAQVGPMVQAVFKGQGRGRILMLAHMDTVYARGTLATQPFRIDGNKVYGLGIADDKQGVALIIHSVAMLKQLGSQHFEAITVLINGDEEISSPGSRQHITRLAQDQDAVFSFEGGGENGALVLATSGIGAAYLHVKGHASHAGAAPEEGVNALMELSHQILQLKDYSLPALGLKLNWTLAQAGSTRNVIPAQASAQADARVLRAGDFDHLERALKQKIQYKQLPDSEVSIRLEQRRPPMEATAASKALAHRAQTIYRQELNIDMPVYEQATGGGTDAAFAALQARGPVIEGLGLTGYGAHGSQPEYVLLNSIVPRLYLVTRMVQEVSSGAAP